LNSEETVPRGRTEDGTFKAERVPGEPLTREELAGMLSDILKKLHARATGDGKREVVGTRQVRCYTVPSPQVWREITRRYYFDPADPNGDAPPCPEILRGRQWVTLAQERLGVEATP